MSESGEASPAVSVVVIVYNDAERLPVAVDSVLRQTLRSLEVIIADDCSTDGTPEVARQLMSRDSRVRYTRLPENSGGCGAPRNAGIQVARAPYVMFLDSDDRYETHACKNLLEAIEDTGADFAMGLARRQNMDTKSATQWYPELFRERRVVGGLQESPQLISDTISVNKLYRRSFLDEHELRFPVDIHYEDQLFTYQAYSCATSIAIIPETVYIWRIYPSHGQQSITRNRHRIDNFRHRLEANRRIDAFARANVNEDLRRVKDLKFLTHDLRLYLEDSIGGDPAVTHEVLDLADPYLRSIPRDRYDELPTGLRVACAMALRHDADGVRGAMLFDRQNVLGGRISRHGDRWFWSSAQGPPGPDPRLAPDSWENALADVTGSTLVRAPAASFDMLHEVREVRRSSRGLRVRGMTFDGLGKLAAGDDWTLSLSLVRRDAPSEAVQVAMATCSAEGERGEWVEWSAELPLDSQVFRIDHRVLWDLCVEVRIDDAAPLRQVVQWRCGDAEVSAPVRGPGGRVFSDRLQAYRTWNGRFALRTVLRGWVRLRIGRRLERRLKPFLRKKVVQRWKRVDSARLRSPIYDAMRRLPLDPRSVVLEAHLGTIHGDSPKYVGEALREIRPDLQRTWVLPRGHRAPSPGDRVVQRGTYRYLLALARASFLVDNQTFPGYFRKRAGQRYLQTWHGIPLKKMGIDVGDSAQLTAEAASGDRGVGAWDQLVVPCPYFEDVFVPAFQFRGELVRYGTPRNDPLVTGAIDRTDVLRRLDIPTDKKVVLYAPTFRTDQNRRPISLPFNIRQFVEGLGPDWVLLLRPHYLNRIHVPGGVRTSVLDVSGVEDVNDLYVAADVLVTDYSSVMFDYALLRKPIVYYTYDYEEYLGKRGVYFDLKDVGPGPFVQTTEELVHAVRDALTHQHRYDQDLEKFIDRYCGREDGMASRRAALALLGRD